jgi:hypothetical protein
MIAGIVKSGSVSLVAICISVEAVSAAAARPTSTPARRSLPAATAAAVAAPPGTIRPTLFPLSWAQATVNQLLTWREIRLSSHRQTKLAASLSSARPVQYQFSMVHRPP